MKKDIKQEILGTGLKLFTEYGYANVTMRMIADALNISVGNLTYHIKRKEDLIEAVLIERNQNFMIPEMPKTPEELYEFFRFGAEDQKRDDFFFRFYDQLEKISPRLYSLQVVAITRRRKVLQDAFAALHKTGYILDEEYPGQFDSLIDVLNMIKIHWIPSNAAYPDSQDSSMNMIRSLMYPVLTKKGKISFRELKRERTH